MKATAALGVTALVVAPVGGVLKAGRRQVTVDRTLATTRSIEFDALVVAAGTTTADIKLVVLLQEAFRHCKALAAWGDGTAVLKAARIPVKGPGIELAGEVDKDFTARLAAALGLHRAWDRAPEDHGLGRTTRWGMTMRSARTPRPGGAVHGAGASTVSAW